MIAKSIKGESPEEISEALEKSMTDGFRPTLAIIFISVRLDQNDICQALVEKDIRIFGASTFHEFVDHEIDDNAAAILLLDINPKYFSVVLEDFSDSSDLEAARKIGKAGTTKFSQPIFIISGSHIETQGHHIIQGLVEEVGEEAMIVGGMASDESFDNKDFVFDDKQASYQGIISLIMDGDKINIQGTGISGWKRIGTERTITKSDGNWVYTIDHQPALEVLEKYTGIKIEHDDSDDIYKKLGASYPLQVIRADGTFLMTPLLLYNNETKAVMCARVVSEGAKFFFSLPPDFDVVDTVIESAQKIKESQMPEADAMIVFSCVARLELLGPMASDEIDRLQKTWDVPLVGFFCYGEFGKSEGSNIPDFIGTTCNWVAIKEKDVE